MATAKPGAEGTKLTLYELRREYEQIADLLSDVEAMPEDEADRMQALQTVLGQLKGELQERAEGLAHVILVKDAEVDWLKSQAAVFQEEADRIKRRAKTRANNVDWLREYLAFQLAEYGGDSTVKIESASVTITLNKKPAKERLQVDDASQLSDDFKRVILRMPKSKVPKELEMYISTEEVSQADLNAYYEETGLAPTGTTPIPIKRPLKIY